MYKKRSHSCPKTTSLAVFPVLVDDKSILLIAQAKPYSSISPPPFFPSHHIYISLYKIFQEILLLFTLKTYQEFDHISGPPIL